MSSKSQHVLLQALKYGNILLTGLILAYPKKFFNLVYTKCKRPTKAQLTASSQQQDQLSELKGIVGQEILNKFKAACKIVKREQGISTQDSLELYGLYKQAINGPCNLPQPSQINYEAKIKWEHWTKFKDLSHEDAMMLYVEYIVRLLPQYTDTLANITKDIVESGDESDNNISEKDLFESEDEDDDNNLDERKKLNDNQNNSNEEKYARGLGMSVSKMTNSIGQEFLQEKEAVEMTQESQAFFSLLDNENIEEIESSIKGGFNLLSKNEQGSTALHYCIENELSEDVFLTLLQTFPDINAQDSDGYTPLHIAALNENAHAISILMSKGANPYIQDHEGQSTLDISTAAIKKIIQEYSTNHIQPTENQ